MIRRRNVSSNSGVLLSSRPTNQATITQLSRTTTTVTISFSFGNGNRRLVVIQKGDGSTAAVPKDGIVYAVMPIYGIGDDLGNLTYACFDTNHLNDYNNPETSIIISNLKRGKTLYTIFIYEFNYTDTSYYNATITLANKKSFYTLL